MGLLAGPCGDGRLAVAASMATARLAAALPGNGKPTFMLGDKNFPEEYILGDLYQQALEAKGYTVKLKPNLGSTEIAWKALQSGQIQAYPEYDGTLLANVAASPRTPPTPPRRRRRPRPGLRRTGTCSPT